MQVRPLTAEEIEKYEARLKDIFKGGRIPSPRKTFTCSFCGEGINYLKYADHLEKAHPGGRRYKPYPKSKPNATSVFAECQQRDATPEELAEWEDSHVA